MSDVQRTLDDNRVAVGELIAAAERCSDVWTVPRAPGKWSPSQIVEHVARSLEEAANVVSGRPSKFLKLPSFLCPVARALFFNRTLRRVTFPKAKAARALDPAAGPATLAEARRHLDAALEKFGRDCRACAQAGRAVESEAFGRVSLTDYARFVALHTRHHCKQMPGGT
jgi:hypothetical protein